MGKACGNTCIAAIHATWGRLCSQVDGAEAGLLKTLAPSLSTQTRAADRTPREG